jgi:hypothetical protein
MIVAFPVNIFQLSVKYRRKYSVWTSVGNVFKFFKKTLFRINNIKLYKLIVKKTNYANKIVLNIKNKKINLNNIHPNIHYKFNVLPKKKLN